jgi:antitoxin VapB
MMHTAKLFKNGSSQAVRLPREYRFKGKEVYITKTPQGVLLSEKDPWELFEEGIKEISADFMAERRQPKVQKRKGL